MSARLRIRNLSLRLPGGDPAEARAFARQLGRVLAQQGGGKGGRIRISQRPGESQRALVERIARAIRDGQR